MLFLLVGWSVCETCTLMQHRTHTCMNVCIRAEHMLMHKQSPAWGLGWRDVEYAWQIHTSAKVPEQADSIRQGRDSSGNLSRKCAIDVSVTGAHHSVPFTTGKLGRRDSMPKGAPFLWTRGLRKRHRTEAELAAANHSAGSAGGLPSRASRNSEADDASLQPI